MMREGRRCVAVWFFNGRGRGGGRGRARGGFAGETPAVPRRLIRDADDERRFAAVTGIEDAFEFVVALQESVAFVN